MIPALDLLPLDAEPAPELTGSGNRTASVRARGLALLGRARNKWLVVAAVGLAVVLLASLAGVAGFRHLRDVPAEDAFADAQQLFGPVAASLGGARDLEQVVQAGEAADRSLAAMRRHHATADGIVSEKARAVAGVLATQIAVLRAGATVAELNDQNFGLWAETQQDLERGLANLAAATRRLAEEDQDAAASIAHTGRMLGNLERVIGRAVATSAEESLAASLTDLADAKTTADVRAAAEIAARQHAAIRAVTGSLPDGADPAADLETLGEVYGAIAGLALLDGSSLTRWGAMRQDLTVALAGTGVAREVSTAGRQALRGLDRLVARAETRLSDWKASHDEATARNKNDAAALETYVTKMQAQLKRYSALRASLSEWVERVEDPTTTVTYDEGYATLGNAQWDRQMVRDAMTALDVPVAVGDAHNALVSVLDEAIAAMQGAYDGTSDAQWCVTTCYYKDTPGWKRFSQASGRITEAFASAERTWQTAVAGARAEIDNRTLPRRPQV